MANLTEAPNDIAAKLGLGRMSHDFGSILAGYLRSQHLYWQILIA